jgi:hypothetical protein
MVTIVIESMTTALNGGKMNMVSGGSRSPGMKIGGSGQSNFSL